eukprot:3676269-Prymnesium_polylepis.1
MPPPGVVETTGGGGGQWNAARDGATNARTADDSGCHRCESRTARPEQQQQRPVSGILLAPT